MDVYEKYWPWKSEQSARKTQFNQAKRAVSLYFCLHVSPNETPQEYIANSYYFKKQKYLSIELANTYSDLQLEPGGASVCEEKAKELNNSYIFINKI